MSQPGHISRDYLLRQIAAQREAEQRRRLADLLADTTDPEEGDDA